MEAQVSGDVLDVVCINGGPITQVEQEEMPSLLADARAWYSAPSMRLVSGRPWLRVWVCPAGDDAGKSGVKLRYNLSTMSYCDFLQKYSA